MRASIAFQRRGEGARREPPMSRPGDPGRLTVRTCRASSGSPNRIGGWILRDRRGTCLRVLVVVGFEAEIAPERHDVSWGKALHGTSVLPDKTAVALMLRIGRATMSLKSENHLDLAKL